MESLDLMGDLLDFASDIGEEDDDEEHLNKPNRRLSSTLNPNNVLDVFNNHPSPDFEEELEWILNKEAFPSVDTILDVYIEDPRASPKHQSPVSVLDNSTTLSSNSNNSSGHSNDSVMMSICRSFRIPVKARSKQIRKARSDFGSYRCWWSQESLKKVRVVKASSTLGRKCQHCGTEKTPQWRAGPEGPKTLCNACGVRFKSGRLVPEYRPANSPTFSSSLHSNSHRKVVEMRKQKQMMGMLVVKPMEKG